MAETALKTLSLRNLGTNLAQSSSKKLIIYLKRGEPIFTLALSIDLIFADMLVVL